MAKKKKSIDLADKNIEYSLNDDSIKVIHFNPNTMTVDINIHSEGQKVRSESIRFAQLPKHIKQLVRPI